MQNEIDTTYSQDPIPQQQKPALSSAKKRLILILSLVSIVIVVSLILLLQWYNSPIQKFSRLLDEENYKEAAYLLDEMSGKTRDLALSKIEALQEKQFKNIYASYNNDEISQLTAEGELHKLEQLSSTSTIKTAWITFDKLVRSKEAYNTAKDCENDGDTFSAIQSYLEVLSDDTNYADAIDRINELKVSYLNEIILLATSDLEDRDIRSFKAYYLDCVTLLPEDETYIKQVEQTFIPVAIDGAAAMADAGYLMEAIDLLQGLETEDESVRTKIEEYSDAYVQQVLALSEASAAESAYDTALAVLEEALVLFPDNSTLQSALKEKQDAYRNHLFDSAAAKAKEGDYHGAVAILEKGVEYFGETKDLTAKIEEYTAKFPIRLDSITVSKGNNYHTKKTDKDIYGNIFTQGLLFSLSYSKDTSCETEYVANKQYDRFVGTILISESTQDKKEICIKIYVDDILRYDSGILTKKSEPIALDVDISGGTFVKINVSGLTNGYGTLLISEASFGF